MGHSNILLFPLSNDLIKWKTDFWRDSVTLIVRDLVKHDTVCSKKNFLRVWDLCCIEDKLLWMSTLLKFQRKTNSKEHWRWVAWDSQNWNCSRWTLVVVTEVDNTAYYNKNPVFDTPSVFKLRENTRFFKLFCVLKMGWAENNMVNNNEADTNNSFPKLHGLINKQGFPHCS